MAGRPRLLSVNPVLTCSLCKGYLINAMTLIRCMHSFCKSCIYRYLDGSSTCPTCQQRVFRSRMDLHMVHDKTLQSIVYKVVPGLYDNEMRRRRDFYERTDDTGGRTEEKGFPERMILSERDKISVVLKHKQDEPGAPHFFALNLELPAGIPVWVVLKYLRDKFMPPSSLVVHLLLQEKRESFVFKDKHSFDYVVLDPDFTLIDVCYIAKYNLAEPLKLAFTFVQFDPKSYENKALLESSTMPQNSILNRMQPPLKNGSNTNNKNGDHQHVISNNNSNNNNNNNNSSKAKNNVQYPKIRVDTKSIDMAKGSLDSTFMKTYSRGSHISNGMSNNCNEEDSTEEEEVDSWDSNVSTTIDSLTTTPPTATGKQPPQQQQQQSAVAVLRISAKHSKSLVAAIHANKTPPIIARPQSLRVGGEQAKDKPVGKLAMAPVLVQSATVGHHRKSSQEKKSHHHHHHHKAHNNTLSPTSASASTVAGKPPTVLKIKLNTSPTTSETLTITSPPIRDNRHSIFEKNTSTAASSSCLSSSSSSSNNTTITSSTTAEYPSVTSIKIKPLVAPSSPPPPTLRETRAGSVESSSSGGRKKRKSEDRSSRDRVTPDSDDAPLSKKAKKAKNKKTSNNFNGYSSQPLINETAYVSVQPKDLLNPENFGWGNACSLWESQLRIPSPLAVPFTVSFARRKHKQEEQKSTVIPSSRSFLEENFDLKRNPVLVKPQPNRIWRKRRQISPPPVPVKLPPPDFKMSSRLSSILDVVASDKPLEMFPIPTSPGSSPHRDSYLDHNNRSHVDFDHGLDSGNRPSSSSSGNINADVFRMECPIGASMTPCSSPSMDNIMSNPPGASSSPQISSYTPQASPQRLPEVISNRKHSSSSTEIKYSICPLFSEELQDRGPPLNFDELNVQETIELFITNISNFFWALESGDSGIRRRISQTCLEKRAVLERILGILRKLTIVVSPNQIERVLQLESAIEKYFQVEPDLSLLPSAIGVAEFVSSLDAETLRRCKEDEVPTYNVYDSGVDGSTSASPPPPVPTASSSYSPPAKKVKLEVEENEKKEVTQKEGTSQGEALPTADDDDDDDVKIVTEESKSSISEIAVSEHKPKDAICILGQEEISKENQSEKRIDDKETALPPLDVIQDSPTTVEPLASKTLLSGPSPDQNLTDEFLDIEASVLNALVDEVSKAEESAELSHLESESQRPTGDENLRINQEEQGEAEKEKEEEHVEEIKVEEKQTDNEKEEEEVDKKEEDKEVEKKIEVKEQLQEELNCNEEHDEENKLDDTIGEDTPMNVEMTNDTTAYEAKDIEAYGTTKKQDDDENTDCCTSDEIFAGVAQTIDCLIDSVKESLLSPAYSEDSSDISNDESFEYEGDADDDAEEDSDNKDHAFEVADAMESRDALEEISSNEVRRFFEVEKDELTDSDEIQQAFDCLVVIPFEEKDTADQRMVLERTLAEEATLPRRPIPGFPGTFGYNVCRTLIPYTSKSAHSEARPHDTLLCLRDYPITQWLTTPLKVSSMFCGKFLDISTCSTKPVNNMELVPYVPRSRDAIENLFLLSGLIPSSPSAPLALHDYVSTHKDSSEQKSDNVGSQNRTKSLLEFIKIQRKSHNVQVSASPNFGDADMNVHRWEEVDGITVTPPSGVSSVPGSLNVH